jgi:hypothetical protein
MGRWEDGEMGRWFDGEMVVKHLKQMASLSKMNQSWFKDECGFPGSTHREKKQKKPKTKEKQIFWGLL